MFEEIAPLTLLPAGFDVDATSGPCCAGSPTAAAAPDLADRHGRLAEDPVRWLPMLREGRRRGLPCRHLVTALAAWLLPRRPRRGRPSCRSTTRWHRVCARSRRPTPASRRHWSEPRSRSMRCSAATCGKMRSWSTSSRPCSRGSHMPACAPPLPTDRAAREVWDARPRQPSSGLEPVRAAGRCRAGGKQSSFTSGGTDESTHDGLSSRGRHDPGPRVVGQPTRADQRSNGRTSTRRPSRSTPNRSGRRRRSRSAPTAATTSTSTRPRSSARRRTSTRA